MIELIDSANEGQTEQCEYHISQFIKKYNQPIYNPKTIDKINFHFADQEIEKIFLYKSSNFYNVKEDVLEDRKKNFLKRITAEFIHSDLNPIET